MKTMKKNLLYLLAFISVIFAACNPLKDEINNITPTPYTKAMTITLSTVDYGLLPTSNYAQKGFYFATTADANASIPVILNAKFPQLANGSTANVSYNSMPAQIKPADSVLSSTAAVPTQYTVTDADYLATNNNNNKNFNTAGLLKFLDIKFPVKKDNQLVVISYAYFESGVASPAVPVAETYLYLKGAWTKAYQVSQAQYISAGKMNVYNFAAADEPNLVGYFNAFLKADGSVSGKAKLGDVKYVSYAFFSSSTVTFQRIRAMIFDGTNWGTKSVALGPLAFLRKNDTWVPDPTVYYTIVKADCSVLTGSGVATDAAITNAVSFGSFDMSGGANNWTDEQINNAVALILKGKYASAPVDEAVFYNITVTLFKGPKPTVVKTFVKTSTGFVFVPPVP